VTSKSARVATHRFPWFRFPYFWFVGVFVATFGIPGSVIADPPTSDAAETASATPETQQAGGPNDPLEGKTIDYWIGQLSSQSYSRRERATFVLGQVGDRVIDPLTEATKQGDFEVVSRAVRILQMSAVRQEPDDDGGAVARLKKIAGQAVGARGVVARQALDTIVQMRGAQAETALAEAGVFIGQSTVLPTSPRMIAMVRIDDDWNGDVAALKWLRWIQGYDTIVLTQSGCSDEVLQAACRLPGLSRLQLNNGKLSNTSLEALTDLEQILELAFNYVQFEQPPADVIVRMALVESLRIFGTNLDNDGAEKIRAAFPGLMMEITKGAFLGVESDPTRGECRILRVIPGGGADRAGIRAGDVIIEVEGVKIKDFFDLKAEIGKASVQESIELKLLRGPPGDEEELTLKASLGRMPVQ